MKHHSIQQVSAIAMLFFGCMLTTIGFFMEPAGEVSSSVMWILGQCLIYAGSVFGLKNYVDLKIGNNETNK